MKKIFCITLILGVAWLGSYAQDNGSLNDDDAYYQDDNTSSPPDPATPDATTDNGGATYQQFYDQLSPVGQWISYPEYGNVWVPNQLPADFEPYMTGGHWVYTDYGMTWVSDYSWGWACFHYGRWFFDATYGWIWVPGYDWSPAWCMWGDYDGYYCWAPFGPGAVISPHYRPDPPAEGAASRAAEARALADPAYVSRRMAELAPAAAELRGLDEAAERLAAKAEPSAYGPGAVVEAGREGSEEGT